MKENIIKYVKKFQKGLIPKREFINKINPIILKIPFYQGYKSIDIKHEFYAHILSKIEKIISLYIEIPNANFTTWLNVVLKREFIYFITKKNKINEFESLQVIEATNNYSYQIQETLNPTNKSSIDISQLTEKEKNVVALKYGIKIYKRDISESINQILKKLDKKKSIGNTISRKYYKILKLQKQISKTEDFDKKLILENELKKIKFYKRKLEKFFNSYSILPTNKWVGEQLGLSTGTIAAYLNKIKKKLLKNNIF